MKRILICEDERSIREMVSINLSRRGFTVFEASSGEEALQIYDTTPNLDIAVLDVMLPKMDGFAVCRELRKRNADMGIVMLTARSQETEKVKAFQLGADDYVTKPFGISELIARLEALGRRMARTDIGDLASGEFSLDLRTHTLKRSGELIELTQVEFQLMQCFLENIGTPISRKDILLYVWGTSYYGDEKIVDVNIRRLRLKIEKDPSEPRHIVTVWGKGYCWYE
ncbi:MAG: response regulator transcription factor [Clostridia bacterium]|nr:response regulator transcription factor [Clostridia bacterium]